MRKDLMTGPQGHNAYYDFVRRKTFGKDKKKEGIKWLHRAQLRSVQKVR